MIRRLLEASRFAFREVPTAERIRFWLQELRTPELLTECVSSWTAAALQSAPRTARIGRPFARSWNDCDAAGARARRPDAEPR